MVLEYLMLRRSDLFGFTPGGRVLDAEEDYGFTPGGQVLDAEEDYGEDDFGGDLEDVPLFAGSSGSDDSDPDAALDQILGEMGDDEEFGEDALQVPFDTAALRSELADVIFYGVKAAIVGDSGIDRRVYEFFENTGQIGGAAVAPGDLEELAQAMLADPAFAQWNSLTDSQRTAFVHSAIAYAAVPGIEMDWDDEFSRKWNQGGWKTVPGDVYSTVKAFVTGDLPKIMYTSLAELPFAGAAMQQLGWDPRNADQMMNSRVLLLYFLGKINPIDASIAANITQNGQSIIAATQAERQALPGGGVVVTEEVLASSIPLPEPAQQLSDSGIGLPEPPQILAIGYGLAVAGSILGFFR